MSKVGQTRKFDSAAARWAGIGPYYAMFPNAFADHVIQRYSAPGDLVIDPFAGRGTTPYWAALNGRKAIGIEINPVGWVYGQTKLSPASRTSVERVIAEVENEAWRHRNAVAKLPEFFRWCFCENVLRFLVAARKLLQWRSRKADRTAMALILVHLHGKRTDSLSNQMRQTKALSPDYAVRWWQERDSQPPEIDPGSFLRGKLDWRYARGVPSPIGAKMLLGDSSTRITEVARQMQRDRAQKASLLFTSPPYCGVTNYHYDQWIRLWMLGGAEHPVAPPDKNRGKFCDRDAYRNLLEDIFDRCSRLLRSDAVVYVRTDSRPLTLDITAETLSSVFPKHRMRKLRRPLKGPSQTTLFGGKATAEGEVDIVLRR